MGPPCCGWTQFSMHLGGRQRQRRKLQLYGSPLILLFFFFPLILLNHLLSTSEGAAWIPLEDTSVEKTPGLLILWPSKSGFWARSLQSARLTPPRLLFDCLRYQTPHSVLPPLGQQDQRPKLNLQRQTSAQNQSSQDQLKQVIKTRQCLKKHQISPYFKRRK